MKVKYKLYKSNNSNLMAASEEGSEIINEFEIEQPAPPGVGSHLVFRGVNGEERIFYRVNNVLIAFDFMDTDKPSSPNEAYVFASPAL
jgi:hypothetical protein